MSQQTLDEAFQLIEANSDLNNFFGPRSENEIKKAELALNCVFPPTYRQFLLKYGAGGFGHNEISGITREGESPHLNVVKETLEDRRNGYISDDLVELFNIGDGSEECLDMSVKNDEMENSIILARPGSGFNEFDGELEELDKDFGDMLLRIVKWGLESRE